MNDRSFKLQQMNRHIDLQAHPFWHGDDRAADASAPSDDSECFEQMVFERAVRRELSGDVDFE